MLHKFIGFLASTLGMLLTDETGAIKVKPIDASTTKWADRARGAATEYATEAEASASEWQAKTVAAKDNYGQAISAAGIKERFARGVTKAGAAKYARKIRDVAAGRFSGGVDAATPDYKAGAEPYYSALAAITLPARKPRGDPGNIARVEAVTKTLNAKRLAMLGGGGA